MKQSLFFYFLFLTCFVQLYILSVYPFIEFCGMYMGILLSGVGLRVLRTFLSTSSFGMTLCLTYL